MVLQNLVQKGIDSYMKVGIGDSAEKAFALAG
jgi:hypothetical protein